MAKPTIVVRVAFASDPMVASPSWTTITNDVVAFDIKRGRQNELDRMEAGTAVVVVNNMGGHYWPQNTGGDYTPNVLPIKRINIRATASTGTWSYRKSFAVSRASGAVTDYQFPLKIYYGAGADGTESVEGITAGKVYCDSKCQTDFDDIRITTSDGVTLLNYWVETVTASTSEVIWIKFNSIGTGATTFYVYYGNSSAASVSNGSDTFIAFDDFERGTDGDSVDVAGGTITWTKSLAGTAAAEIDTAQYYKGTRSCRLYADGVNSAAIYFSQAAADNTYAIRMRVRKNDAARFVLNHGNGTVSPWVEYRATEALSYYDVAYNDTGTSIGVDTWALLEINNIDFTSSTFDIFQDGASAQDAAATYTTASYDDVVYLRAYVAAADVNIDNVIIRNWRSTEPAWGAWGGETNASYSLNVPYDLFTGFIEAYEPRFLAPMSTKTQMTLRCVDMIKSISRLMLNDGGGYSEEASGTRVANVLTDLGWLGGLDSDTGQSDMQATGALANVNALNHLFTVQESEAGIMYIAGDGDVQFEDRFHRVKSPHITSQATFGDGAGDMEYHDIKVSYDDYYIYNDIRMTRTGGTEQTASDATSQTAYGKRSLVKTGLLFTSDNEALSYAEFYKTRYKDPHMRIDSITIKPETDEADLYPKVLGYDISTRITLQLDQAMIDEDYFIEGISHHYSQNDPWMTTWQLGKADSWIYWQLGVAGFGELGEKTYLYF